MKLSDFDFELPDELIARYPAPRRDASRLLVVDRDRQTLTHAHFKDLPDILQPNDLVVVNDTRVIKARLQATKAETGGRVELLLVESVEDETVWRVMVRASKSPRVGQRLNLEGAEAHAQVETMEGEGFALVRFACDPLELARNHGAVPLPPYLARDAEPEDETRYQTIFARSDAEGSVAAPTAGLHFTPELIDRLEERAINMAQVTLHVGPGTFLPVRTEDLDAHQMHSERFEISEAAAQRIEGAARIVSVGTTVTRVLETVGRPVRPVKSSTQLFIRPGHVFSAVDALVTNFHLPKSTLLMLVSAFAGRELMFEAYRTAVEHRYRFFSYGDAMLIL